MAWSCIRKVTPADLERLDRRATEFCARHGITVADWEDAYNAAERAGDTAPDMPLHWQEQAHRLRRLWWQVKRRALGEPAADGICGGYVGFHVE